MSVEVQTCSKNITFLPTPVCIRPPFMFLVSNSTTISNKLNCTLNTCFLTQCWNATGFSFTMIMRIPVFLPMPVSVPEGDLPVLLRHKRDFSITATVVTAVAASAAAAAATATALAIAIPTAKEINQPSMNTTEALQIQSEINDHLAVGILFANQQIDLLQEQMDIVIQLLTVGCLHSDTGLCITPVAYDNLTRAANYSRELSKMLTGNWSARFKNLTIRLRANIVNVNASKVEVASVSQFVAFMKNVVGWGKQWFGFISMGGLLIFAVVCCLWCICPMMRIHKRDTIAIKQALLSIKSGQSPQVWLSMLDR
ncbi:endogenous retrovirus group K member 13-1 Env polyprotein-like [Mustela putorius furo]|uniref:Endogenous retrovirus group K member 13-1 Env polyprotein-like n=1 Tax=Mustela putorius furo TaxID=9669 RepID=A0A8U0TAK8_MUSPF|nr:endogenous retrovirus group K member 13-1 Env polyprotein-like [Mustela putorius furo]